MDKKSKNTQLLKGLLDTLVLSVLEHKDNYGFGILSAVKERLGEDGHILKDATLYPLLHRLESKHYLQSYMASGDRGVARKYYSLTDDGKIFLAERREDWKTVIQILKQSIFQQGEL